MVAATPKLEVRAVGAEAFEDIYPLLLLFGNRKMSRDDWHRMLFSYPWWNGHARGFALYAGDAAVGFMGTIFSRRSIGGREETLCNASCWIVREEFRSASMLLLKPLLAMRDCTLVNLTPTPRSHEIFKKLGFATLETERLLLCPVANPATLLGGWFTTERADLLQHVTAHEAALHRELADGTRSTSILLRRGGRHCYLVATLGHVKRIPVAEVQYVSDPNFFWNHRALAHAAVLRTMGAAGISIDARFALGRTVRFARRLPAPRLYRPSRPSIAPGAIDGLFSELMVLKI